LLLQAAITALIKSTVPEQAGDAGEGKTFFSREKEVFPFPRAPNPFQEKRYTY
jgi:hypothetical protein